MNEDYVVYVLYSEDHNRTYTGYTSNLIERFKDHNELGKKGYCKRFRPWFVLYAEFFNDKTKARSREKYLKSGHGRNWIKETFIFPTYPTTS